MSRLCRIFVVLLAVVVPFSDARPHKCEQRERSLADLDLAEDSLNRAKQLYPNCEENESSNSSECSKKDKSLGFIEVALDLVSNAKKNIPICPHVPTEEPLTTEESTPEVTTEEPTPEVTTEEPTSEFTTEEPTPEVTTEARRPKDCQEVQAAGITTSGVYTVWLQGKSVRVRCDMDTDGGGWTVIQRRGNFLVQEDFYRDWQEYKNGFGNLERDYWIGNDAIFALTNQGDYSLRMDMTAADGSRAYALYREFTIKDEQANYKLHVIGYEGNTGDSMVLLSNNQMFSTKDRKNDKNAGRCADMKKGGFWYSNCAWCNPNGLYKPGVSDMDSMYYHDFKQYVGLSSFDMKIKRRGRVSFETNLHI